AQVEPVGLYRRARRCAELPAGAGGRHPGRRGIYHRRSRHGDEPAQPRAAGRGLPWRAAARRRRRVRYAAGDRQGPPRAWLCAALLLARSYEPMTDHLPRAILFDMDDTILTDTVNGDRCWQAAFEELVEQALPVHAETAIAAIKEQ